MSWGVLLINFELFFSLQVFEPEPKIVEWVCPIPVRRILKLVFKGGLLGQNYRCLWKLRRWGYKTTLHLRKNTMWRGSLLRSNRIVWQQFCCCGMKSFNKINVTGCDSLVDVAHGIGWTTYVWRLVCYLYIVFCLMHIMMSIWVGYTLLAD